jgi:predicted CxxxxCH...CXXCH cytochrome family protein
LLPNTWNDNPTMKHEASGFLAGPLAQLEATARTRDQASWTTTFTATTKACNACHAAGHVAFIVIGNDGALLGTR